MSIAKLTKNLIDWNIQRVISCFFLLPFSAFFMQKGVPFFEPPHKSLLA